MDLILHITGSMDRAGAETMLMNLYREMDRSKIQFDFIFFTEKKGDYEEEIKALGGKVYRILEDMPLKRMWALKHFLHKHPEYKIVHTHTLLNSGFNLMAAYLAKVPNRIAHAHSAGYIADSKIFGMVYRKLALKLIARFGTKYIACSGKAGQFLYPNQKKVLLLRNSVDVEYFAAANAKYKDYLKVEFNIDDKYLKIIQVGRLQKVKNHTFSLKLAETLKSRDISFKMFFVGEGKLFNKLKKEIITRNLQKEVFLLGLRGDIPELMASADVMLMPSLHEGFPVVLVESQAVGLPALISKNITSEVDLGLGLVQFEDLEESVDLWIASLIVAKMRDKPRIEDRMSVLRKRGFDVKANANKLTSLYNSMS